MGNQGKIGKKQSCKIIRFSSYFRSEFYFREETITVSREPLFSNTGVFESIELHCRH